VKQTRGRATVRVAAAIAILAATPAARGWPHHRDEAAELEEQRQRAQAVEAGERWRARGVAAVDDMATALCGEMEQPFLAEAATDELRRIGPPAIKPLLEVAVRRQRDCGIGGAIASIVCATGSGEDDVLTALGDGRAGGVDAALAVLRALGRDPDERRWQRLLACPSRDRLIARALPGFRRILLDPVHPLPRDALWTVHYIAPDATALLPAMIELLRRDEKTAVATAETLGDFGEAAAPAVPELRRLIAVGGPRRLAAVHGLGSIGRPAREAVADMAGPLVAALPRLCRTPPRFGVEDALVVGIVHAMIEIGGSEAARLVPHALLAYDRLHACRFDVQAKERRTALQRLALCAREVKGYSPWLVRPDRCR